MPPLLFLVAATSRQAQRQADQTLPGSGRGEFTALSYLPEVIYILPRHSFLHLNDDPGASEQLTTSATRKQANSASR